jgi:hypothetical protein
MVKSWAKGARGERDVAKKVGGKRTGFAYQNTPDVTTDFAVYSVKNYKARWPMVMDEFKQLSSLSPDKNHYVVLKIDHQWICIETLDQHAGDHGEDLSLDSSP